MKDNRGAVVVPAKYDLEPQFSEGLGRVRLNKKWGLINHAGEAITPPIYNKIDPQSEGLIGACLGTWPNSQCGYLDQTGQTIIPFAYTSVDFFRKEQDGMAKVEKNKKHGAIRRDGSEAIPIIYDKSLIIEDGYALVTINGRSGILRTSGKEVLKPIYDAIAYDTWGGKLVNKGIFTVASGGKWGFVNTRGDVVADFKYDKRAFFGRHYAIVSRDGERFRLNRNGEEEPLDLSTLPIPY
ncbi:hypothetical protein PS273GM_00155 [Stutzerimonas stutzeri]|uniref:WG repeat-containing protein n=1 Tax=Stutzerimonas stutzeri TaxID=316 RepID=A0A172WJN2_STUST|nr:hypothetical protein PS273GM_00155 [Stutzerimonas stutzeri]